MSEPFAIFGPGICVVQRTDVAGSPVNIGYSQEFSIDLSASQKDLFGQNQYPLVSARGTVKATGKVKAAVVSGSAWNQVFFGQSFTSGGFKWNVGEAGAIPATSPYTVTVVNSATFDADLGVTYSATGLPLQRVASGPTVGQYSVSAGVYTFAAADEELGVKVTYTSTLTGSGQNMVVANQPLGFTPTFQLDYYTNLNQPAAKPFAIRLFSCIGSKLSLATKLEDFMMPEIDFGFFANAAGNVFEMVFPEIS